VHAWQKLKIKGIREYNTSKANKPKKTTIILPTNYSCKSSWKNKQNNKNKKQRHNLPQAL